MTKRATETQIEKFNHLKGDRSFEELGEKLMISPQFLERFAQGLQMQAETTFDKIVAWLEGKNIQPPVG
ncbi:MAG: hypothetical protein GYB65_13780 [Chloroflexi bacterium]|nr:hypothetical protein [Chloroflexota bacterium]